MNILQRPRGAIHSVASGPAGAPAVLFINALGTDLRLWEPLMAHLPPGLRILRFDTPGHGLSDLRETVDIDDIAEDAAALIEAEMQAGGSGPAVVVGQSLGGVVGQALAAARPDLVRALVLSCTAARAGTPEMWQERAEAVLDGGMAALADPTLERWFGPAFRASPEFALWRNMLLRCPAQGYAAACGALGRADLTERTATLRLPTLALAGEADSSTPPDMVEATARLIPGAAFHVLPGAAHITCVEAPAAMAARLLPFLQEHCDV